MSNSKRAQAEELLREAKVLVAGVAKWYNKRSGTIGVDVMTQGDFGIMLDFDKVPGELKRCRSLGEAELKKVEKVIALDKSKNEARLAAKRSGLVAVILTVVPVINDEVEKILKGLGFKEGGGL